MSHVFAEGWLGRVSLLVCPRVVESTCPAPARPLARGLALSVTSAGLALGLVGVYLLPSLASVVLLLSSLGVDGVDGWIARRLRAVSDVGGWLDWSTDTALSYFLVYRVLATQPLLSVVCAGALVFLQAASRAVGRRASGRTVVTLLAVGWVLARGAL